jgi:myosin heavy subunit
MSLDAVKFIGAPIINQGQKVTVQLQFEQDFLPQHDDKVFVLPVCWKTLEERKLIVQTRGSSTITFHKYNLEARKDETFQFVYVQEDTAVGVSCPFTLEEENQKDSLISEISELEHHQVWGPGTTNFSSKGILSLESEDEKSGSSDHDFSILTMSSVQYKFDNDRELQAYLEHTLKEKGKVEKLYEREKAISGEQEERNDQLQKKYNRALDENRKMKEELKRLESDIKQLKCTKETKATALLRMEKSSSTKSVASSDLESVCKKSHSVYNDERSSGKPTLSSIFECPLCWETFDKASGAVNFQHHVHSHFSDDDQP